MHTRALEQSNCRVQIPTGYLLQHLSRDVDGLMYVTTCCIGACGAAENGDMQTKACLGGAIDWRHVGVKWCAFLIWVSLHWVRISASTTCLETLSGTAAARAATQPASTKVCLDDRLGAAVVEGVPTWGSRRVW